MATLVRETGSLELAEDAVGEAFVEASTRWRRDGPPRSPGAWLLTTARRRAIDRVRRDQRFTQRMPLLVADHPPPSPTQLRDDQLALIAGCAHPAISGEAQVALTLRYVCGLSTEQIARSFLVPTETMKKRLTRAKKKIAEAGIPFEVPNPDRIAERLGSICAVVYAAFSEGYASTAGQELIRGSLCDEGVWLSELLCELVPDDSEVHGLAALVLLTDARRYARTDTDGLPVLLEDQDRSRWDRSKIERGLGHLHRAVTLPGIGPYQLLASIAALHDEASSIDETPWRSIAGLYDALIELHDTPVLRLNRAAALCWVEGPAVGLSLMDELAGELAEYSYYHSARAALLAQLGEAPLAVQAYRSAIDRCANDAEIEWMRRRIAGLESR